jgi:hypothetical protein
LRQSPSTSSYPSALSAANCRTSNVRDRALAFDVTCEGAPRFRGEKQDLEVLIGGMYNCRCFAVEHGSERGKVHRKRIDQDKSISPSNLQQSQLREVRLLSVELSVE